MLIAKPVDLWALVFLSGLASAQAFSQEGIITERPSSKRLPLPEFIPDKKPPGFTLPPAPTKKPKKAPNGDPQVVVKGFQFTGNAVFTDEDLHAIAVPFLGRPIDATDLEQLRHRLSQHYIERGYINSGAILPEQVFDDSIIHFWIIEGQLTEIRITGTGRLRPNYVSKRLKQGAGPPLNDKVLQDRYQLILTDPLIERLDGRLMPGLKRGQSILDVEVTPAQSHQLSLSIDNYRPPSIGSEAISLEGWLRNLTGFGDYFGLSLSHSEGRFGIDNNFTIPLSSYDTLLAFRYAKNRASVIEEPLELVNIDNEFRSLEIGLTQPVYRTLAHTVSLGARFTVRKSRNTLLGRGFSFSRGEEEGESKVSALRLSQEFITRQSSQVISLRSTFSVGLKAFDATWHNDDRPDGNFSTWLGQLQFARQVADNGAQIRFRGNVQLTDDELLPLERFAVGGRHSVRGYRENELVRDQGYALSLELHYPLLNHGMRAYIPGQLSAIPFMDYGAAWNQDDSENTQYLHAAGFGLSWIHKGFNAELFYAHDLNQASEKADHNLQDSGIHFRVTTFLF